MKKGFIYLGITALLLGCSSNTIKNNSSTSNIEETPQPEKGNQIESETEPENENEVPAEDNSVEDVEVEEKEISGDYSIDEARKLISKLNLNIVDAENIGIFRKSKFENKMIRNITNNNEMLTLGVSFNNNQFEEVQYSLNNLDNSSFLESTEIYQMTTTSKFTFTSFISSNIKKELTPESKKFIASIEYDNPIDVEVYTFADSDIEIYNRLKGVPNYFDYYYYESNYILNCLIDNSTGKIYDLSELKGFFINDNFIYTDGKYYLPKILEDGTLKLEEVLYGTPVLTTKDGVTLIASDSNYIDTENNTIYFRYPYIYSDIYFVDEEKNVYQFKYADEDDSAQSLLKYSGMTTEKIIIDIDSHFELNKVVVISNENDFFEYYQTRTEQLYIKDGIIIHESILKCLKIEKGLWLSQVLSFSPKYVISAREYNDEIRYIDLDSYSLGLTTDEVFGVIKTGRVVNFAVLENGFINFKQVIKERIGVSSYKYFEVIRDENDDFLFNEISIINNIVIGEDLYILPLN